MGSLKFYSVIGQKFGGLHEELEYLPLKGRHVCPLITMSMILASFRDLEAFLESQLNSGYALCQPRGVRYIQGQTIAIRHYQCVTNGDSRATTSKKRSICKLGPNACDAGLIARYSVDGNKQPCGSVALLEVKLEHRHRPTFLGQPVPQTVREHIESQLQLGVDPVQVASKLQEGALKRSNRESPRIDRVSLLPKCYFKAFNHLLIAKEIELDKNDHKSVALSVSERWRDSVLAYHPLGSDGDGLSAETFCLIISSGFQRGYLKRYGTPLDMVFFDGTHGVVRYDNFSLFTVLVADQKNQGFPVGWMLANNHQSFSSG